MTDTNQARELAKRAGRRALGPITERLDLLRRDMELVFARQDELAAAIEQAVAASHRLESYFDQYRREVDAKVDVLEHRFGDAATGADAMVAELAPEQGPAEAGTALRDRLDHGLLHAQALALDTRTALDRQLGDLRSSTRLTQSLVERALANSGPRPVSGPDRQAGPSAEPAATPVEPAAPATTSYTHPVPSFDLLYRAFEDLHRGTPDIITERQRTDYLELLTDLPHPELPIADLGCGRGELVRLLDDEGAPAVGVDANQGQIGDGDERLFVEDDMFAWLDGQDDASHRAVVAMHVVEHLPIDLQIRLVFEARRVLADGGLLVLETPNLYSLSTAATNFWVDPTHERPVHPLFMEFLAAESGFAKTGLRPLHQVVASFSGSDDAPELAADLDSLIFGHGDIALVAWR